MLKRMSRCFKFDSFEISLAPVWVKLPFLPLCLWTNTTLGLICSKVGRPLHTDHMTFTKDRVCYVRVLIEIDAAKPLVHEVPVKVGDSEWIQLVEYEFEPIYCSTCMKFGHASGDCSRMDGNRVTGNFSNIMQKKGPLLIVIRCKATRLLI